MPNRVVKRVEFDVHPLANQAMYTDSDVQHVVGKPIYQNTDYVIHVVRDTPLMVEGKNGFGVVIVGYHKTFFFRFVVKTAVLRRR